MTSIEAAGQALAPKFHGDDELEYVLAGDEPRPALQRMVEEDERRTLWRLGRALSRLNAQDEDQANYLKLIAQEVADERARLQKRIADIEGIFEERALYQREALNIKSLKVPGIGEWKTRSVPASWRTEDEAAALEALLAHPDEHALFSEKVEQTMLRKADFKGWLDETGVAEFPGMVRTEEHVTVHSPFGGMSATDVLAIIRERVNRP